MSHVVVDFSRLSSHSRVFGCVVDYSINDGTITVGELPFNQQKSNLHVVIKLNEVSNEITDPRLSYHGTIVDVTGLFDGHVLIPSRIEVVDSLDLAKFSTLQRLSQLEDLS